MSIISRTIPLAPGSYTTKAEVRAMSGLSSITDVSDADLNELILSATLRFIRDVTIRREGIRPQVVDPARKVFQLPTGLVADLNADATVGPDDVRVRFEKTNTDGTLATTATGTVSIQSALYGIISTVNALPDEYECVVDYAHYIRPLEIEQAKRAVRYLGTHLAWNRMRAPGRLSRADLTAIGSTDGESRVDHLREIRTKWSRLYREQLALILGQVVL